MSEESPQSWVAVMERADGHWQASYSVSLPPPVYGADGFRSGFHTEDEARAWADQQVAFFTEAQR